MRRTTWISVGVAGLISAALASLAFAQYNRQPWPSERFNPPQQRNMPGEFDYYALVLSWSPSYCAEASDRDNTQCNRSDGRRFSFVLHGLWPQYEKGYPGDCRTARRPFVPEPLIDRMLDIMPSRGLIIHEFRKHGTCSGLDADTYFNTARRLFQSVRIPERFKNPFEALFESPATIVRDFVRANPGLTPDSMAVACGGAGNRLKEIHICFSKDGKLRSCGDNENQRRMCSASSMFVPPVRSTARDDGRNTGQRDDGRNTGQRDDGRNTRQPDDGNAASERQKPDVSPYGNQNRGPYAAPNGGSDGGNARRPNPLPGPRMIENPNDI